MIESTSKLLSTYFQLRIIPVVCSPANFFNSHDDQCSHYDNRMIPFAKELKAKMASTSNHCNQSAQQPQCPESVMEIEQEDGWRNFQSGALRDETFRTLSCEMQTINPSCLGQGLGRQQPMHCTKQRVIFN
jgi:hypothetical protein